MGRGNRKHVLHKNVWGLAGLPLESPRLPSHIGTAARKRGGRRERQRFCASRWEISNFGLFQSVTNQVWTGGCSHAPRASFCVLKVLGSDSGFKSWHLGSSFKERIGIQPGGDANRASEGSPLTGDEMRGHDGAADIHRSQTRSQVLRTHQGSQRCRTSSRFRRRPMTSF